MKPLSYPDGWFPDGFSPPVEDIQDAYVKGQVSDYALDNEIEWALSHPEPPAEVSIYADGDAVVYTEEIPSQTIDLAQNEESISIERDTAEAEWHDSPMKEEVVVMLTIECHRDDVQAVFNSLVEADE